MTELSKEQLAFFVGADYAIRGVATIDGRDKDWRMNMLAGFFASLLCKPSEVDAIIKHGASSIATLRTLYTSAMEAQEIMNKLTKEDKNAD